MRNLQIPAGKRKCECRLNHRVYVCPHARGDGCACIKPNPYFLHEAARAYAIDLRRSYVIGDHPHDVVLARNAGAQGIYVLSGHGRRHLDGIPAGTVVVEGIREAADLIWAGQAPVSPAPAD